MKKGVMKKGVTFYRWREIRKSRRQLEEKIRSALKRSEKRNSFFEASDLLAGLEKEFNQKVLQHLLMEQNLEGVSALKNPETRELLYFLDGKNRREVLQQFGQDFFDC